MLMEKPAFSDNKIRTLLIKLPMFECNIRITFESAHISLTYIFGSEEVDGVLLLLLGKYCELAQQNMQSLVSHYHTKYLKHLELVLVLKF